MRNFWLKEIVIALAILFTVTAIIYKLYIVH